MLQRCVRLAGSLAILLGGVLTTRAQPTQAPAPPTPTPIQVPIEYRNDTMLVQARINGSEPLKFLLDTGFGITMLHPNVSEDLKLRAAGQLTIIGIAGNEQATTYDGAVFDFGGVTYSPRRVASLPSEAQRRRRSRDGILGASFFRRFVVELDPREKMMRLHEPAQFKYSGSGEVIALEFRKDTPIIEAAIVHAGKPAARAKFELDTGCDGCLCLGQPFVEAQALVEPDATADGARKGVGGALQTRQSRLGQLQLGKLTVDDFPASLFIKGSPSDDGLAGHIGMGVLKRFRVILDYSRKQMILEPLK